MTYNQILTGITTAECKVELANHVDTVELAIELGECSYGETEWTEIYRAAAQRVEYLDNRVIH